jgi:outer membrane protein assembly factor BamD
MRLRTRIVAVLLVAAAVAGGACRSGRIKEDPILRLSAAESLAEGKRLMAIEKYEQARKYLVHAFEVEPNSAGGREALLLAADALFLQGGSQNLIQAEAKYRDFQNRFPTSDRAAYVQFQIGKSVAARMERPDRDQAISVKALQAFEDLVRLYPGSEYAEAARAEVRRVRESLAEHEFVVGVFYLRYGLPLAAVSRFERLLTEYDDYTGRDKVIYHLGLAYEKAKRSEDSQAAFTRLRSEHPDSPYAAQAPDKG